MPLRVPAFVAAAAVAAAAALVVHASMAAAPLGASRQARDSRETHLRNLEQLTFSGQNAEAYFSFDGTRLIYQHSATDEECDQIYTMTVAGRDRKLVSTGAGRTTCGYFYPGGDSILYASTHAASAECPPKPSFEHGYVWPIYASYEIYRASADGRHLAPLTTSPGYDAEATVAPDGRIVFTSTRDGDMEIYSMNADGSDVRRLTNRPGPDGGPFFSQDGKRIAFRGRAIDPGPELEDYRALLRKDLWRPTQLEIFVMDRDGGNLKQVTRLGVASFAPSWFPDGRRLIFSSNLDDPKGRNFDLYAIDVDGGRLERVTYSDTFDGFPMFSPDGRKLVFASNRFGKLPGETNVFLAEWVADSPAQDGRRDARGR